MYIFLKTFCLLFTFTLTYKLQYSHFFKSPLIHKPGSFQSTIADYEESIVAENRDLARMPQAPFLLAWLTKEKLEVASLVKDLKKFTRCCIGSKLEVLRTKLGLMNPQLWALHCETFTSRFNLSKL